jgi:hypothetical protein
VLEVLARHPRGEDTETVLVDLDAGLIDEARERARRLELAHVSCLVDDAGLTRSYAHLRPVDLVLACGIFGNISEQDVGATIAGLSTIVASRGSVVWTRHRRPPDQTPTIRALFEQAGFEERSFVQVRDSLASVGRHQLVERPSESGVSARLFTFVGDGSGAAV